MAIKTAITLVVSFVINIAFVEIGLSAEKYWIFFQDKGRVLHKAALKQAEKQLTERARKRRAKVMQLDALVDRTDLPISSDYLLFLQQNDIEIINRSKWLNAVSAHLDETQLRMLQTQPFVKKIQRVAQAQRDIPPIDAGLSKETAAHPATAVDYGLSYTQNSLMRTTELHAEGITGQGVLVAVFDTGFRISHQAFANTKILATYDFIHKDDNVENELNQDTNSQHSHGTAAFSLIGGNSPGNLIGAAYGAEYILAKTEDVPTETPVEEDYWIAAAEWADSLGADIITASLGYLDWYSYKDMDGKTAPITIAADLAAKKGILVVTAAGNEGNKGWFFIIAPADGDSVLAVGAINMSGVIAGFSSRGPTYDGRIKPEVVAPGVSTFAASSSIDKNGMDTYGSFSGTSAATPLAAGAAALILSAYPQLTPMQLREVLLQTASQANTPDNIYGYGLVNALAAVEYLKTAQVPAERIPDNHELVGCYPNPFQQSTTSLTQIVVDLFQDDLLRVEIYNLLGQRVATLWDGARQSGAGQQLLWNGKTADGRLLPSGIYLCHVQIGGHYSRTTRITLLK